MIPLPYFLHEIFHFKLERYLHFPFFPHFFFLFFIFYLLFICSFSAWECSNLKSFLSNDTNLLTLLAIVLELWVFTFLCHSEKKTLKIPSGFKGLTPWSCVEYTFMMDGCGWRHFLQLILMSPVDCHYKAWMRPNIY